MAVFSEVKITRILNQTSIDLGEYVINPFMGCEFACLYCYVRSNRVVSRKPTPWGGYVDIRINAPELLEKELNAKKPGVVLLGSTTECFQPIEKKYQITRQAIEILNKNKVYYVILTRSPYILEYLELLKKGFCRKIYFTINNFRDDFKLNLEPCSPSFESRDRAVKILLDEGVSVVPYFSPVLPWISDINDVFMKFKKAETVEFECLNFNLNNIKDIIDRISSLDFSLGLKYKRMAADRGFYYQTCRDLKINIFNQSVPEKKRCNIYTHKFCDYFKNRYSSVVS